MILARRFLYLGIMPCLLFCGILSSCMGCTFFVVRALLITEYRYGGIFERGSREYTLDDFYSLQLDKMDRYVCLKESGVVIAEGDDESSSGSDDDDDDDDDEEETVIGEDETAAFDEESDEITMLKKIEEVPETDAEKVRHAVIQTYIAFLNGGP